MHIQSTWMLSGSLLLLASRAIWGQDQPPIVNEPALAAEKPEDVAKEREPAIAQPSSASLESHIQLLASPDPNIRRRALTALANIRQETKTGTPALIKALQYNDPGVCAEAAAALGHIGPAEGKAATPALVKALAYSNDAYVRIVAGYALAGIDSEEAKAAIPILIEVLQDEKVHINERSVAAMGLGKFGSEAKAAVPALVKAVMDETHANLRRREAAYRKGRGYAPSGDLASYGWRKALIRALADIGPDPKNAIPTLIPALVIAGRKDPSMGLGEEAVKAQRMIYRVADPAAAENTIPVLVEALAHDDALIREGAAELIGQIGPKAKNAAPALIKALEDENKFVRVSAALALTRMDPQTKVAVPVLIEVLRDEDASIRNEVVRALYRIGPAAKDAVPALVEVTLNKNENFNALAARALGEIGAEAIPLLISALGDNDPFVRERAAQTLAKAAEGAKWSTRRSTPRVAANLVAKAVPALIEALKDPERHVRYRSAQALGEIGTDALAAVEPLVTTLEDQDRYVGWAAVEALENIDPKAAPDAVSRVIADRPTKTNDKGDRLTLLNFDPPLPAVLKRGEQLRVRHSSTLASGSECYIWVSAYTDGKRTPGQGTSGSPKFGRGDSERESFVICHSPTRIDQIRIVMSYGLNSNDPVVELIVAADARWETVATRK